MSTVAYYCVFKMSLGIWRTERKLVRHFLISLSDKISKNFKGWDTIFDSSWFTLNHFSDVAEAQSVFQAEIHRVNKYIRFNAGLMNRLCLQQQTYWVNTGSQMDPIKSLFHSGIRKRVPVLLLCLLEPHISDVVTRCSIGSASVDCASGERVKCFHHPIKS